MIIYNPHSSIYNFSKIEWILDNEACPKQDVSSFLKKLKADLKSLPAKVKDRRNEDPDDDGFDEDEEEEDEDGVEDSIFDQTYETFSIAEDGAVFLGFEESDDDSVMFFGQPAKELTIVLRSAIKRRAERLNQLLHNDR